MRFIYLITLLLFAASHASFSQVTYQNIFPGEKGDTLLGKIRLNYKPTTVLDYNQARDLLWGGIAEHNNGKLEGVYSGFTITIDPKGAHPRTEAYNKDINCEHTWPQSKWSNTNTPKSDLHHLFPSRVEVNSARGSYPFAEIADNQTDTWYRNDKSVSTTPTTYIDEYSELDNAGYFEPREEQKGNIARAIFYFYSMYAANAEKSFFEQQKETLYHWHIQDPVDDEESWRSDFISTLQGNENPFILDSSLIRRAFFPQWQLGAFMSVFPGSYLIESGNDSTVEYYITTNLPDWSAQADQNWVSLQKDLGNGKLKVTATANNSEVSREAIITISSKGISDQTVILFQNGNKASSIQNDTVFINNGFKVFPNPFSNKLSIVFEVDKPANVHIMLFDSKGQIVKSRLDFYPDSGTYTFEMITSDLDPGYFYYYFLIDDKEKQGELLLVR